MESEKTRRLCRELERLGAVTLPYVGSTRQVPGWPDRWIGHPLWTGWLEFKDEKTRLDPLQARRIEKINVCWPGGAYVCRFMGEGLLVQNSELHPLASCLCDPRALLCTLFSLQLKPVRWVEDRQRKLRELLDMFALDFRKKHGDDATLCAVLGDVT
jgi:hypothetical protein